MATRADLIVPIESVIEMRRKREELNILQFPTNLGAHAIVMNFKSYRFNRRDTTNNSVRSTARLDVSDNFIGSVVLPLPTNLNDSFSVNVSQTELGSIGSIVSQVSSEVNASEKSIFDALSGVAGEIGTDFSKITVDAIKRVLGVSGVSVSRDSLLRYFGRYTLENVFSGIGTALDTGFGATINPHVSLAFQGVDLKNHEFSWKFAPKNETESDRLNNITNYLKMHSLPDYKGMNIDSKVGSDALKTVTQRGYLEYPSVVDIFFVGIQQQYFYYFKRCMVKSISVNYTSEGPAFLRGGKPAVVTLDMGLIEQSIHTRKDYEELLSNG